MLDRPELALVHDGELEDVRLLLDELRAPYENSCKSRDPGSPPEPSRLLVVTSRLAVSLRYRRVPGGPPGSPVWIGVTDHQAESLRTFLTQAGFDFVVRRPVHPSAMRMLVRKALFGGTESRRGGRVAVGTGVSCRAGLRRLHGTLVDLSPTGCRLFLPERPAPGALLQVQLPGDLSGGSRFGIAGKVVRSDPANPEGGEASEIAVGLRFEPVTAGVRDGLVRLLATLASGPAMQSARESGGWPGTRAPRARFGEQVHSLGDGPSPLIARDLSLGGIRIEAGPTLAVGRQLKLAIESGGRHEPVIVVARVARDDGADGLALHFESIEGDGARRLEQLVSRLPPLAERAEPEGPRQILSALGARLVRFAR